MSRKLWTACILVAAGTAGAVAHEIDDGTTEETTEVVALSDTLADESSDDPPSNEPNAVAPSVSEEDPAGRTPAARTAERSNSPTGSTTTVTTSAEVPDDPSGDSDPAGSDPGSPHPSEHNTPESPPTSSGDSASDTIPSTTTSTSLAPATTPGPTSATTVSVAPKPTTSTTSPITSAQSDATPTSSTTTAPATTAAPRTRTVLHDPIPASAVVMSVNPRAPLSSQNWGQAVVNGSAHNGALPNEGLHGPPMSNGETLRLGPVSDPTDPSRQVLRFAVEFNADGRFRDPLFHDGSRVQLAHIQRPTLPRGETVWQAFRYMHSDFGANGANDRQILNQYHDGDHSSGLNPYLAWIVQGDQLSIFIKHSSCSAPTNKPPCGHAVTLFSESDTEATQWQNYVVRSQVGADGFVQIWRNGTMIVDYQGPFGYYNQSVNNDYVALSYYHWHAYNPFDTSVPIREVWWDWSSIILDPSDSFSYDEVHAHLQANVGLDLD